MSMLIAGYILFGLAVALCELLRKKTRRVDFLTCANLFFGAGYIATPLYYYLFQPVNIDVDVVNRSAVFLISILGYFSLVLGWVVIGNKYVATNCDYQISQRVYRKLAYFFLLLSILATFLYFQSFGGLASALSSGALMRYGFQEDVVGGLAFMKHVMSSLPLAIYILLSFSILSPTPFWKSKPVFLYLIGLVIFGLQILVTSSRGAIVDLVLVHLLVLLFLGRLTKKVSVSAFVVIIFLVLFGKQFYYAAAASASGSNFSEAFSYLHEVRQFSGGENSSVVLAKIFKEFRHTIMSLDLAYASAGNEVDYTYFSDIPWSLTRIVPQRLLQSIVERPDTISLINTRLLSGQDEASTPPGLVAHCFYAAGYIGVVIGMFLYGLFGRLLNNGFSRALAYDSSTAAVFAICLLLYGQYIVNGDPNVYLYSILWPLIAVLILLIIAPRSRTSKDASHSRNLNNA